MIIFISSYYLIQSFNLISPYLELPSHIFSYPILYHLMFYLFSVIICVYLSVPYLMSPCIPLLSHLILMSTHIVLAVGRGGISPFNLSLGGGALGSEARGLNLLFWGDLVWASGEGEGRGFPQTNEGGRPLCPVVKLNASCHASRRFTMGVARGWPLDSCPRAANPEGHRASCPR